VEEPPQEAQLLDRRQRVQVPVELQEREPQVPSGPDAECTPGVEGWRPELGEGRLELQPVRGRQPAQPGGQQGPRGASLGEHQGAAALRRQVTERPQREPLLQCEAPARHDLKEENPESSEAHWMGQH